MQMLFIYTYCSTLNQTQLILCIICSCSNVLPCYPPPSSHPLYHRYLVSVGCIKPLCDMLTVQDARIVIITLEGLENILKVGQNDAASNGGVNPYSLLIEEAYGKFHIH